MNYSKIIEQIRNKEPDSLDTLYKTYGTKFYDYCIRKWQLTEDAAWEVVYKTLETIIFKGPAYQFESEAHFNNFLFKVLVNFLRQQYRKKQAANPDLELVDLSDENGNVKFIQNQIDKKAFEEYYRTESIEPETIHNLKEALSKLLPVEKDLLLLKAQNYTYDEIAEILGIENNQLKVKHHRAKQKLLTLLNETSI